MAEQTRSGQWLARRVESGSVKLKMFPTKEEAIEWENG